MRKSLTKQEIVKKRKEIDRIFKTGRSASSPGLKLIAAPNQIGMSRVIVIPVRHYGNSVQRNRIRRQIKEIWRCEKERLVSGYDYAFVVYPGKAFDYEILKRLMVSLCEKAGVAL